MTRVVGLWAALRMLLLGLGTAAGTMCLSFGGMSLEWNVTAGVLLLAMLWRPDTHLTSLVLAVVAFWWLLTTPTPLLWTLVLVGILTTMHVLSGWAEIASPQAVLTAAAWRRLFLACLGLTGAGWAMTGVGVAATTWVPHNAAWVLVAAGVLAAGLVAAALASGESWGDDGN